MTNMKSKEPLTRLNNGFLIMKRTVPRKITKKSSKRCNESVIPLLPSSIKDREDNSIMVMMMKPMRISDLIVIF
jgi:hypothetical protein